MASPAAVLSILVKAQGAQMAAGQLTAVDKAGRKAGTGLARTEKQAKTTSKTFSALGSTAKLAGVTLGAAGLAAGVKSAVSEFREAQKVGAQTTAVLKSTGGAAKVTKKHVEDLAGAISKKSGIDDEQIQASENMLLTFTKLRNETGKGNKIFDQATQAVTDMSVALGQSGKSSAIQLGKALNDPIKGITALRRVGVSFTADQQKQIEALVKSGHQLEAQRLILKELRTEFAGSAAAQATAGDKLKVAWGNLAEAIGGLLVPALDKAAVFFTKVIDQAVRGQGIAKFIVPAFMEIKQSVTDLVAVLGPFLEYIGPKLVSAFRALPAPVQGAVAAFAALGLVFAVSSPLMAGLTAFAAAAILIKRNWSTIGPVIAQVRASISAWVDKNRADINAIIDLFQKVGSVAKAVFEVAFPVFVATVKRQMDSMKVAIQGALQLITGVINVFLGLLRGDWSRAWNGLKDIAVGALKVAYGAVKTATAPFREVGSRITSAIIDGLAGLGHMILQRFKEAADFVKDKITGLFSGIGGLIGKGVGKIPGIGDGIGKMPTGKKGSAGLMGANAKMAPFARIGAGFGLSVSSGLRPGAVTSSGNPSYHASGQAIDEAGPASGMLAYFKYLRSFFGSRLAELIYTPGGVGIKDGKPFRYTGQVAADHFDHVHVAFAGGGKGDGIGKRMRGAFMGDGAGFIPGFGAIPASAYTYQAFVKYMAKQGIPLGSIGSGHSPAQMYMAADKYFNVGVGGRKSRPKLEYVYTGKFQKGQKGDGIGKRMRGAFMGDGYGKTGLEALWQRAGGPASAANIAAAVALAESGGNSAATHRNTDGSIDRGLWQINSVHGAMSTLNPLANARAAVKISSRGRNWSPWVTFKTGAYKRFLGKAAAKQKAAAKKGASNVKQSGKAHQIASKVAFGSGITDQQNAERLAQMDRDAQVAASIQQEQQRVQDQADQDAADAQQEAMDALTRQLEETNRILDLQRQIGADLLRKYNVSQTDYGTLAKAIAAVASGEIGGKVGLGFMTPGFSGGGSRY